jgi:hypothetical protein
MESKHPFAGFRKKVRVVKPSRPSCPLRGNGGGGLRRRVESKVNFKTTYKTGFSARERYVNHAKACAEAISKEAMSEGDVDAVTKDTGYGRVLGEIIRDWGVACAKRTGTSRLERYVIYESCCFTGPIERLPV